MQQVSVLETNIGSSTTGNSADTQIIFNDDGTLRGDTGLVFNKTTDALTVAGLVTAGSATITGALTVDTSTLKVDATNHRVGIGTATPGQLLDIVGPAIFARVKTNVTTYGGFRVENNNGGVYLGVDDTAASFFGTANIRALYADGAYPLGLYTNAVKRYEIDSTGISTWSVAGTTAMTLNSTGLGIGGSPVNPLTAYGAAIAKAPVLFLTNVGSPGDYGWDFSVDGAVNGNLFIRRVNAYTKNDVLEFDRANGNLIMTPSTTATALTVNGQLTFNATSNTNLRFSYRGSDGTTRVANITLA